MNFKTLKARFLNQGDLNSPVVMLGGLLALLILLYSFIVEPFISWQAQKQANLEQLLKKTEKIIAMQKVEPLWLRAADAFDAKVVEIHHTVDAGKSKAVNQQKLQNIVREMLSKYHMTMDKMMFLDADSAVEGMAAVSIRFRATGLLVDHFHFIDALASYPGLLILQSWNFNTIQDVPVSLIRIEGFFLDDGEKK